MSNPSLLCVPYRFKTSKLYSQIPDSGLGDFTVTRTTTPTAGRATRVNAAGLIELVPDNVPRLDYPLGGITAGCPSLLVEPSAVNLALQSEDLGTGWSLVNLLAFGSGSVLNTTATLDPYGTNVADLIVANATVGQHRVDRGTVSASGSYTFSVFVKAAGYGFIRLRIGGDGAVFNLSNGSTSGIAAGIIASSQNYGNGWYRCIISKAAALANEDIRVNMQPTVSTADFGGDGTSGIYVFGAQYETGSAATSYIPTTTAAVTRNADVVSVSGAVSGSIGQTQGTIYCEFVNTLVASYTESYVYRVFADANNEIWARKEGGGNTYSFRWRANSQNTTFLNVAVPNGVSKIAFGYKSGDTALFLNGSQVATTNTDVRAFSVNPTTIALGSTSSGQFFNDRIRAHAIYPTRLPNTGPNSLQSLTQ